MQVLKGVIVEHDAEKWRVKWRRTERGGNHTEIPHMEVILEISGLCITRLSAGLRKDARSNSWKWAIWSMLPYQQTSHWGIRFKCRTSFTSQWSKTNYRICRQIYVINMCVDKYVISSFVVFPYKSPVEYDLDAWLGCQNIATFSKRNFRPRREERKRLLQEFFFPLQ